MNEADISAAPGMAMRLWVLVGLEVTFCLPRSRSLEQEGTTALLPPVKGQVITSPSSGWKTDTRFSHGLTRVIWVCSSMLKNPRSPSSPEPSSGSQTSTDPGRL